MLSDQLRAYLTAETKYADIKDCTELLDSKILDSLQLIQLIVFLEGKAGVSIPPDELLPTNFSSIENMLLLVKKLKA